LYDSSVTGERSDGTESLCQVAEGESTTRGLACVVCGASGLVSDEVCGLKAKNLLSKFIDGSSCLRTGSIFAEVDGLAGLFEEDCRGWQRSEHNKR
jgi:hypothetical protein